MPAVTQNDSLAELVAVCDVIKEKADKAAEQMGRQRRYYSLQEMLDARIRAGYRRRHHQRL